MDIVNINSNGQIFKDLFLDSTRRIGIVALQPIFLAVMIYVHEPDTSNIHIQFPVSSFDDKVSLANFRSLKAASIFLKES